ncbi:hypothetical protein [Lacinutrix jangbogonensis]|uniref:hypothetical protein n=1 Tax=Lacinutrix jangbogonensis TaxID=1469557 RepID=UPI00053EB266|nr:hypothetical protein [Lacinutrix jangbogonensis]
MKVKLLVILISVLFISCQNDDEQNDTEQNNDVQTEAIEGSWNLKHVYGGFSPVNIDYTFGDVKWTFNESNRNVVIENNVLTTGPEDIHAGLDSGIYSFEIQLENDLQTLYIDSVEIGTILISGDNLDIDNGLALDGFVNKGK